jgi:signal transduction histidine kinase
MNISDRNIILISMLLALVLSILLAMTGFYGRTQHLIDDGIQLRWGEIADFSDIVIIDIDESSMQALSSQLGTWPYERYVYGSLLEYLRQTGANKVVFDILFSETRAGDDEFLQQIHLTEQTHLAAVLLHDYRFEDARQKGLIIEKRWQVRHLPKDENGREMFPIKGALFPIYDLLGAAHTGLISIIPDADGALRDVPLIFNIDEDFMPSMALSVLAGKTSETLTFDWNSDTARYADYEWPVTDEGMVTLKYPANVTALPVVPFYKVLLAMLDANPEGVSKETFAGKTVFIGSSAAILGDYTYIPGRGRIHGLGVLAMTYHSLKHNNVLRTGDWTFNFLVTLPWLLILGSLLLRQGIQPVSLYVGYIVATLIAAVLVVILYRNLNVQTWSLFPTVLGLLFVTILTLIQAIHLQFEKQKLYFEKVAAEQAKELKAKFLAHMTHELRTPLTAIMGYNRLLIDEKPEAETVDKYLGIIDQNSEHLLNLINNILDQSKIDAGQLQLVISDGSMQELVEQTVLLLKPLAKKKGLELHNVMDESVPKVLKFDRIRLKQIILNLIGNALKFTETGYIEVKTSWQEGNLSIAVRDTGPGIAEDDLERIFQSFQQTDKVIASEISGTGLGLTISRNLASMMGGGISVASKLGEGTVFTLKIKADEGGVPASEDITSEDGRAEASAKLDIRRILLADDNPDSRQLLSIFLKRGGYEVIPAEDGQQAFDKLTESPDLVLLDMNMPIMNGDEVAIKMREAEFSGPILALTAATDQESVDTMMGAGCNGFIRKPIDFQTLMHQVKEVSGFSHQG